MKTMRLDAEQRIEEAEDNVEYFKGVKNACKTMELYIRRLTAKKMIKNMLTYTSGML